MSKAVLLPGNRFRLYRETATPGTFAYVGLGTTISFTRANNFEDATAPDLADPLVTPARESALRSTQWDLAFSGKVDVDAFADLETDFASGTPHKYQIKVDRATGTDKTYTGLIWYERLEEQTQDNGFVTFSATCRGDGPVASASVT